MAIHPTAIIDPQAEISETAEIGPYVIIEGPVEVGADTQIRAHAYINGWTKIGSNCDIHPYTVVGNLPQDFHYDGERSYCKIGNNVTIREGATVHRGTQPESSTILGDECYLMAYAHVGHNCILGKGVKVYNMVAISGHVEVDDYVIISGYSLVHQFVRIGTLAFCAPGSRVTMDVPPFCMVSHEAEIINHNVIGMRRLGYDQDAIQEVREAFRTLYRSGMTFRKAVEHLEQTVHSQAAKILVDFIKVDSKRGYCTGRTRYRNRTSTTLKNQENES